MDFDFRCALESTLIADGYATQEVLDGLSDRELLNLYKQWFVARYPIGNWTCGI